MLVFEFFCTHCCAWISEETVHGFAHHNSWGELDETRPSCEVRVDGVVYESEDDYYEKHPEAMTWQPSVPQKR